MTPTPITLSQPETLRALTMRGARPNAAPAALSLGAGAVSQLAPDTARRAAEIIASWSSVMLSMGSLMNVLLKGGVSPSSGVLQGMWDRQKLTRAVSSAARAGAVADSDVELIVRTVREVNRVGARRSEYIHQVWGHSTEFDDCLLLIAPTVLAAGLAAPRMVQRDADWWRHSLPDGAVRADGGGGGFPAFPAVSSQSWLNLRVCRPSDLETDARAMISAHSLIDLLTHSLSKLPNHDRARAHLRQLHGLRPVP